MTWKNKERWRIQAVQMDNLRGMIGVKRKDKMKNEKIREKFGIKKGVLDLIDESVLRWFGHIERMPEERLVKRIYDSEWRGKNDRGRPELRWIDGVRGITKKRGVKEIKVAKGIARDRDK